MFFYANYLCIIMHLFIFTDLSKNFRNQPSNSTVKIGDKHTLKCQAPKGFPNASVHWLHNNKRLTAKKNVIDIRSTMNGESVVTFHKIAWENRGAYVCVAENMVIKRNSSSAFLTVKGNYVNVFQCSYVNI